MRFVPIWLGLLVLSSTLVSAQSSRPSIREHVYARTVARSLSLPHAPVQRIAPGGARGVAVDYDGLRLRRLRFRDEASALRYGESLDGAVEVRGHQVVHLQGERLADAAFAERALDVAWSVLRAPAASSRSLRRVRSKPAQPLRTGAQPLRVEGSNQPRPRRAPTAEPRAEDRPRPQPRQADPAPRQENTLEDLSGEWTTQGGTVTLSAPKRGGRTDEYTLTFSLGGETLTRKGVFDGRSLTIEHERDEDSKASSGPQDLPRGNYRGARGAIEGEEPGGPQSGGDGDEQDEADEQERGPERGAYSLSQVTRGDKRRSTLRAGSADREGPTPVVSFQREKSVVRIVISGSRTDSSVAPETATTYTGTVTLFAHTVPETEGTFTWSTTSRDVELNPDDARLMVTGLKPTRRVSLRCTFRSKDGEQTRTTHDLAVVRVVFEADTNQRYGFDTMDGTDQPRVSVRKNDHTTVKMKVEGGDASKIVLASRDESRATAGAPSGGTIRITGGRVDKVTTRIVARLKKADGRPGLVAGVLWVCVYKRKTIDATIYLVHDSTSAGTALGIGTYNVSTAQRDLNSWLKAAVVRANLTDGGTKNIRYDLNNNGALDLEPGGTSDEERAISAALTGRGQKVVVIKDVSWLFRLSTAAEAGATTLELKSGYSGQMKYLKLNDTFPLGTGATKENVTISAVSGTTVTITRPLQHAHTTSDGLAFPLGGLSGNPLWAEPGPGGVELTETLGHELGHALLDWKDLDAVKNLMNYSTGNTSTELRFHGQPLHYSSGTENQWDTVPSR